MLPCLNLESRAKDVFKDFPPSALPLIDILLAIDPAEWKSASDALRSERRRRTAVQQQAKDEEEAANNTRNSKREEEEMTSTSSLRRSKKMEPSRSAGSSSNNRPSSSKPPYNYCNGRLYCSCRPLGLKNPWSYDQIFWRCRQWKNPKICELFKWVDDVDESNDGIEEVHEAELPTNDEGNNNVNEEVLVLLEESNRKNTKLKRKMVFTEG